MNKKKTVSFDENEFREKLSKQEKDIEELKVSVETIAERLYKLIEDKEKDQKKEEEKEEKEESDEIPFVRFGGILGILDRRSEELRQEKKRQENDKEKKR